jgi:hypothetical protein
VKGTVAGTWMCGCGNAHPIGQTCPEDALRAELEQAQATEMTIGATGRTHHYWLDRVTRNDFTSDDADTVQHVLFEFGAGGYPGGSFTQHLLRAIGSADPSNRHRLGIAFPVHVGLVDICRTIGVEHLAEAARRP